MNNNDCSVSGILVVNKPVGITSHDVVSRIRRLYGTKQVGHTGTLDPLASGVLPVLIGRAVKASEYILSSDKEYIAGLRLGMETDTEDITGHLLNENNKIPPEKEVTDTIGHFTGTIEQIPPMFSAIKVNGQPLYKLARKGQVIERESRSVIINSISSKKIAECDYTLNISCSKGTYIRTLCADIGKALGCGGVMSSLIRTRTGPFHIGDSHTLDEIENMDEKARNLIIRPVDELFSSDPSITLSGYPLTLFKNGVPLDQNKMSLDYEPGTRLRIYDKDGFLALAEACSENDLKKIRSLKLFRI